MFRSTSPSLPKVFGLATLLAVCSAPALADSPKVFGWVEEGLIFPEKVAVKFKLDTGALTSSMHAEDIDLFEKDGDDWVRFTLELEDIDTEEKVEKRLERELVRDIKVRGAGGAEERPVVLMKVCLGNNIYEEQFSLNDRDKMNYPVLIGRRTLENLGLVDSSKTFTVEPDCSE
ncbi:retropepsin-like aspartic peptidase RloA3 [Pseudomonas sp. SST3]|uniref:retropepsin-like aspartic peptidase RloA3 n=1 Tax=Pseudomonas sp. SST3 TaxID=2267882 RepID=UPI000DFBBEB2|nr:ATP-dependent zinc protease [Pseudomonas sp. SST3]NKQ11069.1 ATP-dependent zinc protease [Pseudomonas sp. SST3]